MKYHFFFTLSTTVPLARDTSQHIETKEFLKTEHLAAVSYALQKCTFFTHPLRTTVYFLPSHTHKRQIKKYAPLPQHRLGVGLLLPPLPVSQHAHRQNRRRRPPIH